MRVNGLGASVKAQPARRTERARGAFRVESAEPAQAPPVQSAPIEILDALIAIQSDAPRREREQERRLAAAQRTLDLLEKLRLNLLDGAPSAGELDALALAIDLRIDFGDEDRTLYAIVEDIKLRARIELAKHGR